MNDLMHLIPQELHAGVIDIFTEYHPMRTGANEYNAWVQFPTYTCTIDMLDGDQGTGMAPINDKTTPEEARLLAIERAAENLLVLRAMQKQLEAR